MLRPTAALTILLLPLLAGCPGDGGAGPGTTASRLAIVGPPPAGAPSGAVLDPAPVVELQDANGQPFALAGRNVSASLVSAGPAGSLTGTLSVQTDAGGRAVFADLRISGAAGSWRLRFESAGLAAATSGIIQLVAGAAASLEAHAGNLQTAVAGSAVAQAPTVRARDASGNAVAGVSVLFEAENGGSVEGGVAVTDPSGLAAPARWTLGTAVGLNTLRASSPLLPGVTVGFIATGTVGPPAVLSVVAGDGQTAAAGGSPPVSPAVLLTDALGHPLPGVAVTFAVALGGGAILPASALTDAAGTATATSWTLGLLPGLNRITASRAGVPSVTLTATALLWEVELLASGTGLSCARDAAGLPFCWGSNATGQLGDGLFASRPMPAPVSGGLSFASLSAGNGHSCGVTSGGEGYCWGANESGQLGDASTLPKAVPTAVSGDITWSVILAGAGFTCGLDSDGVAYCWGFNGNGQLGIGGAGNRNVPTLLAGSPEFAGLSAGGAHACGLQADALLFCWGSNGNGRLGDGTTQARSVPTASGVGQSWAQVRAGAAHTCGITLAGAGYCWGSGAGGRLGNGATTDQLVPAVLSGTLSLSAIGAGLAHSCALATDGQLHCWGSNGSGQLGDGTTAGRLIPTAVVGGLGFSALAVGAEHTCGRSSGGGVYCFGRNDQGAVGDGTLVNRPRPVGVVRP